MMIKRLALLTVLLVPLLAHADPCRVGTVTSVTGPEVQLKRGAQQFTPGTGQALCQGDVFITGANSIVNLHLRDGTVITVGKSSQFVIHEYHLYKHKPSIALFDLVQGALRGVTGLIARHSHRLEITTNVATIGIRGTTFWGGYGLSPDGAVDVVMLDGHGVYVKTAAGQVELDKPGLGTTVVPGGAAPTAPKSWPDAKLQRAVATVTVDAAPAAPANSAPAS